MFDESPTEQYLYMTLKIIKKSMVNGIEGKKKKNKLLSITVKRSLENRHLLDFVSKFIFLKSHLNL